MVEKFCLYGHQNGKLEEGGNLDSLVFTIKPWFCWTLNFYNHQGWNDEEWGNFTKKLNEGWN